MADDDDERIIYYWQISSTISRGQPPTYNTYEQRMGRMWMLDGVWSGDLQRYLRYC